MSKARVNSQEKKWNLLNSGKNFNSNKILPEIIELLSLRGIKNEQDALNFLHPDYAKLVNPFDLLDMDLAVHSISETIKNKERITIYGDYDVDGITSTALLVDFFNKIGAKVDYYIPNRQEEGYGLNLDAISEIAERGTKLIITVDCGSTSLEEIKLANELGLKVVVTDHHTIKQKDGKDHLPKAAAVINPRRQGSKYNEEISGVGVAFKLVCALQEKY